MGVQARWPPKHQAPYTSQGARDSDVQPCKSRQAEESARFMQNSNWPFIIFLALSTTLKGK